MGLLGCDKSYPDVNVQATPVASNKGVAQPKSKARAQPARDESKPKPKPETAAQAAEESRKYAEVAPASWTLGELNDVGPAGPATATPSGIVMVTLAGELVVGQWKPNGDITPIERDKSEFAAYGRGPALAGQHAYWIRGRSLMRRPLKSGEPEVLASDAREGTRVAAALVGNGNTKKAVVAYIAQVGEELVARLWIEHQAPVTLTPEGNQATSVNLIPSGDELLAVILEGRTSMSPIHARRLQLRGKVPQVGEDVVVWVGPPSQPLSEVVSLQGPDGEAWSFLALERSVTDFGLASFRVHKQPQMDVEVSWLAYPNGINPAPVATGTACGQPIVVFARPSEQRPRSPQELHVAKVSGPKLGASEVVARSRAFNNISVATVQGGALIAWTADWRTWARTIFCKKPAN